MAQQKRLKLQRNPFMKLQALIDALSKIEAPADAEVLIDVTDLVGPSVYESESVRFNEHGDCIIVL